LFSPSRVIEQRALQRALLWHRTVPRLKATLAGCACSMVAAFALAAVLDFLPGAGHARFLISQILLLGVIAPLVVLYFGFDSTRRILPVARVHGLEATDPGTEAPLRLMGASRRPGLPNGPGCRSPPQFLSYRPRRMLVPLLRQIWRGLLTF
jgi:ABC-type nitrate/sulfonate/bicarbonate transport system permease component